MVVAAGAALVVVVVVMTEAEEVDVAVMDELVVDGLTGQVGSDTTTLICWTRVHVDVSPPARARAWTCWGVRLKPKI